MPRQSPPIPGNAASAPRPVSVPAWGVPGAGPDSGPDRSGPLRSMRPTVEEVLPPDLRPIVVEPETRETAGDHSRPMREAARRLQPDRVEQLRECRDRQTVAILPRTIIANKSQA